MAAAAKAPEFLEYSGKDLGGIRSLVLAYRTRKEPVYLDTETTGLNPRSSRLSMVQLRQGRRVPVVIDVRHCDLARLGAELDPLFDGQLLVVGMNLKFDYQFLRQHLGVQMHRVYDVMLAEQVLYGLGKSDGRKEGVEFHLKSIAERRGIEMSKGEREWFIDLDQRPDEWNAPFPEAQVRYGAKDITVLTDIFEQQTAELGEKELIETALLEMRALPMIAEMELAGVHIDVEGWRAFIAEKEAEARAIEEEALGVYGAAIVQARAEKFDLEAGGYLQWEEAKAAQEQRLQEVWGHNLLSEEGIKWGTFKIERMKAWRAENPNPGRPKIDASPPNLGSSQQLLEAFRVMGIRMPSGEPVTSTASEVLVSLEDTYPEIELLLRFRKAQKFVDSFGETLLAKIDPTTLRIHPEYQQIGASTGRMSCTNPNWQQVPSKGDGKRLRELVKAEPGNVMLTADFSNIELRILAHLTRDETMLRFFREGLDLHSETAKFMYGLSADVSEKVLKDKANGPVPGWSYRDVAKTINFGLVYGMSPSKLARTLRVPKEKAQQLFSAYFRMYPGVEKWLATAREYGLREMKVQTLVGRKRFFSLPAEPTKPMRGAAGTSYQEYRKAMQEYTALRSRVERQSMNTPIQGTSADITKLALALLFERGFLDIGKVIAVVHDEVVAEVPEQHTARAKAELEQAMWDAALKWLTRVDMPRPIAEVSDHWHKD
jgi:DNA polymerase-1